MTWANPDKKKIIMLIGAEGSLAVARVFRELKALPEISNRYAFEFYTDREIRNNKVRESIRCPSLEGRLTKNH